MGTGWVRKYYQEEGTQEKKKKTKEKEKENEKETVWKRKINKRKEK